jgi:hypothetical protein
VADDEARHFGWCVQRMAELGHRWGRQLYRCTVQVRYMYVELRYMLNCSRVCGWLSWGTGGAGISTPNGFTCALQLPYRPICL